MIKGILRSIRYKLTAIFIWKITIKSVQDWFWMRRRLFLLWLHDAPKYQRQVEMGAYLLKKGTMYQVGQPFLIKDEFTKKTKTRYIDNLFYNFKANKVTHRFSDKPIKGFSEPFIKQLRA